MLQLCFGTFCGGELPPTSGVNIPNGQLMFIRELCSSRHSCKDNTMINCYSKPSLFCHLVDFLFSSMFWAFFRGKGYRRLLPCETGHWPAKIEIFNKTYLKEHRYSRDKSQMVRDSIALRIVQIHLLGGVTSLTLPGILAPD